MSSLSYQQRKQKSVFQLASSARRRVKGVMWCCRRLAGGTMKVCDLFPLNGIYRKTNADCCACPGHSQLHGAEKCCFPVETEALLNLSSACMETKTRQSRD